jgi:DNA-binding CsgD family transcriptional regulator
MKGGDKLFNRTEFEIQMIREGVTYKDLAKILNIGVSTLYRKMKNGGSFSREEIAILMKTLNIEDPRGIFF